MLQKWKDIIINWINCYSIENSKTAGVTTESLLNIISHLRENFSLDESKSSLLEACTVAEFVAEKYPEFKFENGTVVAETEDELYLVASLLLYFVCVNSKDVDLKSAMCSNLSGYDQDSILKFSKSLMEYAPITRSVVEAAITASCGQGSVAMETGDMTVAATPPALRSLHGEVRRLQAALDAERFDRNYLQEELSRTNLKFEKLLKDKEQYKLDIMNLKAKISLCCGQEQGLQDNDPQVESATKFTRQLEELEDRLVKTQEQLDDAVFEKDTYKAKLIEVKQDRDKWLAVSQQESSRASQLFEELEVARRNLVSVQDLVAELRQHNRLNRLDSSFLECDDPDTSLQSLPHNISVCSEACANVIEVQLRDERANVDTLTQQISSLQVQLNEMNLKAVSEKESYEKIISDKDSNIVELNHQINEIRDKNNNLETLYKNETIKLNDEINELEQKIKDNNTNHRQMIEVKMREIQTLQEEKLSLLESLSDETTKLETVINSLRTEIESEKQSNTEIRESYENQLMRLNEKVLCRNNELVEKAEKIEMLQVDLRNEKEMSHKHYNDVCTLREEMKAVESSLQEKMQEMDDMRQTLEHKVATMSTQLDEHKTTLADVKQHCAELELCKTELEAEITERAKRCEEIEKEMDSKQNTFTEDIESMKSDLNERSAVINTLQTHLQDEIHFKVELQNEIHKLQSDREHLQADLNKLNAELLQLKNDLSEKEKTIDALDLCLREKKSFSEKIKEENIKLHEEIIRLSADILQKDDCLKVLNVELESAKTDFDQVKKSQRKKLKKIKVKTKQSFEVLKQKLVTLNTEIEELKKTVETLNKEKADKCKEIAQVKAMENEIYMKLVNQKKSYEKTISDLNKNISELKHCIDIEVEEKNNLQTVYDTGITKLNNNINELEQKINDINSNSQILINTKLNEIQTLQEEKLSLVKSLSDETTKLETMITSLRTEIESEKQSNTEMRESYENQLMRLNEKVLNRNNELVELQNSNFEKGEKIEMLQVELRNEKEMSHKHYNDVCTLREEMTAVESSLQEKTQEMDDMRQTLEHKVATMSAQLDEHKTTLANVKQHCAELELCKTELEAEITERAERCKEIEKEIESKQKTFSKDIESLKVDLNERNASVINTLQTDLNEMNDELLKLKSVLVEKEKTIEAMDLCLKEAKNASDKIKEGNMELTEEISRLSAKISQKDECLKALTIELDSLKSNIEQDISSNKQSFEVLNRDLSKVSAERDSLKKDLEVVYKEKFEKCKEVTHLKMQLLKSKESYEKTISDQENNIVELKHRINEEIDENNNLKQLYNIETIKLSNEINELEQKLKYNTDNSKKIIETNMRELQTLQEEKLSLTSKLETMMTNLRTEIESEKQKSEKIEMLQAELRKEKEMSHKHYNDVCTLREEMKAVESSLQEKTQEMDDMRQTLEHKVATMSTQLDEHKTTLSNVKQHCAELELCKTGLEAEITVRAKRCEEMEKEMECKQNTFSEDLESMKADLNEKSAVINTLQTHLQDEIHFKVELQNEMHKLQSNREHLHKDLNKMNDELLKLKSVLAEKENTIEAMELYLTETRDASEKIKEENAKLNKEITRLSALVSQKVDRIKSLTNELDFLKSVIEQDVSSNKQSLEALNKELCEVIAERDSLKTELDVVYKEKTEKCEEVTQLEIQLHKSVNEKESLEKIISELDNNILELKHRINEEIDENNNLKILHNNETTKLNNEINELEQKLKDSTDYSQRIIEAKMQEIQTLQEETSKLETVITNLRTEIESEKQSNTEMRERYENQLMRLNEKVLNRNNELVEFQNRNLQTGEKIEMLQAELRNEKEMSHKHYNDVCTLREEMKAVESSLQEKTQEMEDMRQTLEHKVATMSAQLDEHKTTLANVKQHCAELELCKTELEAEITERTKRCEEMEKEMESKQNTFTEDVESMKADLNERSAVINTLQTQLQDEIHFKVELQNEMLKLQSDKEHLHEDLNKINDEMLEFKNVVTEKEKTIEALELCIKEEKLDIENITAENRKLKEEIAKLHTEISEKEECINSLTTNLESVKSNIEQDDSSNKQSFEALNKELCEVSAERDSLKKELDVVYKEKTEKCKEISVLKERDAMLAAIRHQLVEEKAVKEQYQKELENKMSCISKLQKNLGEINKEREALSILKRENEVLIQAVGQRETFAVQNEHKLLRKYAENAEMELRDLHHQVDNTSSDTHTSTESLKTISDLEMIIQDKNRTITTLQSDITYLKTLMAESENKLIDVTKDLDVANENCHQLSSQLKKLVHQKNEEIGELKRQVSKMSANESRATQIIKVSAKYQAIILKKIMEIKSNTVLKELTNFGNSNNCDNELRRSFIGSITMEDLESFVETTDRHMKKCSEKRSILQKERDRLAEVNRIHETEIINLKKFLNELSVSFQTFSSMKELYGQKLSRVVSVQRTVRREILGLEGHVSDACLGRLERDYAGVMQDLVEAVMQLDRWSERCISRTISAEKLQQAFLSDTERTSADKFHNASLDVRLDELETALRRLLEAAARTSRNAPAPPRDVTLTEVRAEYEDKLDRMKTKMKQLYTEQIAVFKEKQKEEVEALELALKEARRRQAEQAQHYEQHVRALTAELWKVGEKFLVQRDEAQWLRQQRPASLMSLQNIHSSTIEEPSRPSDTHSLRSLPIHNNETKKKEGRGLHMSDEEGEVFDNRWLQELSTPRRQSAAPAGQRLSELRWRNSLCPPHLKSSYPAETQFTNAIDEEDIKCVGGPRQQRKEVGITAYKKPGPPTPSKQAGRLSATDSELRESLRVEADPQPSRKTSTPSRIRALFRSAKNDTTDGTPRTRRLSNIFRKK